MGKKRKTDTVKQFTWRDLAQCDVYTEKKRKFSHDSKKDPTIRPSPRFHAATFPNEVKEGNDGYDWISLPDVNGVYRWKKLKNMDQAKSAEEYYDQYPEHRDSPKRDPSEIVEKLNTISQELKKQNIYLFRVGWKKVGDFIDNAWDDAEDVVRKHAHVKKLLKDSSDDTPMNVVSMIFWTDHRQYWSTHDGELTLQHAIQKGDSDIVLKLFRKSFGKQFYWNGKESGAFIIKY
jgi:hypothetical protein